jgi:hypothetical protein
MLDKLRNYLKRKYQLLQLKIKEFKGQYYYRLRSLAIKGIAVAAKTVVVVITLKLLGIL